MCRPYRLSVFHRKTAYPQSPQRPSGIDVVRHLTGDTRPLDGPYTGYRRRPDANGERVGCAGTNEERRITIVVGVNHTSRLWTCMKRGQREENPESANYKVRTSHAHPFARGGQCNFAASLPALVWVLPADHMGLKGGRHDGEAEVEVSEMKARGHTFYQIRLTEGNALSQEVSIVHQNEWQATKRAALSLSLQSLATRHTQLPVSAG